MTKKYSVFFGIAVLLTAAMFTLAGCEIEPEGEDLKVPKEYQNTTWKWTAENSGSRTVEFKVTEVVYTVTPPSGSPTTKTRKVTEVGKSDSDNRWIITCDNSKGADTMFFLSYDGTGVMQNFSPKINFTKQ